MKLTVIIPVFNEEKTIMQVIANVRSCGVPDLEVIVVNDCSTDGTTEKLASLPDLPGLTILTHDVNMGKGAAIRTAQKAVTGDAVIIQDADLEYSPEELPRLFRPIEQGIADAVFGSRYSGREHLVDTFWHYTGNRILTVLSNFCSNLHLTDMETCYKMIRADIFKELTLECNRFGFEPEITAKLSDLDCRIYEMPISYNPRSNAEGKKIGWKDGFAAIWYILKYNIFNVKS